MASHMIPRERCEYSAIVDRPPLKLPGGARLAFWTIVNYEVWDISRPMARQVLPAPTGQVLLPDVPNWSWHEYGMRVGVWRFFDLFRRLAIRPTLSINARVCEDYERVARAAHEAGWEFMGHAYEQGPMHLIEDQQAMIERSVGVIERFTGAKPVGWLGPGLTQTYDTPELLAAAGIKYIGDWVYDDEPGAAGQCERRAVDDRRIGGALARDHAALPRKAAARRAISSGDTSSMCIVTYHLWPNGSSIVPMRSP